MYFPRRRAARMVAPTQVVRSFAWSSLRAMRRGDPLVHSELMVWPTMCGRKVRTTVSTSGSSGIGFGQSIGQPGEVRH